MPLLLPVIYAYGKHFRETIRLWRRKMTDDVRCVVTCDVTGLQHLLSWTRCRTSWWRRRDEDQKTDTDRLSIARRTWACEIMSREQCRHSFCTQNRADRRQQITSRHGAASQSLSLQLAARISLIRSVIIRIILIITSNLLHHFFTNLLKIIIFILLYTYPFYI